MAKTKHKSETVALVVGTSAERCRIRTVVESLGMVALEYITGRELLIDLENAVPQLVIANFRLLDMSGVELAETLKKRLPKLPCLVLGGAADAPALVRSGLPFLVKPVTAEQLTEEADFLFGRRSLDPDDVQDDLSRLTSRELEILELTATGMSAREIGENLGLSTKTIEAHRSHIGDKTRCLSVREMARLWRAWKQLQGE